MSETTQEKPEREEKNAVFSQENPQAAATAAVHRVPKSHVQSQQDELMAELGITIPVEVVPLPSQGKVYPQTSPLFQKELLEIKAMTAREEDILTSRAYLKNGTVITKLIQSCLADKSVDVRGMLSGDRNAILVAIRITGYGSSYGGTVTCPTCDQPWEHQFELAELPLKNLAINPVRPGENLFELTLPKTGAVIQFKFLTGKDEEEMTLTAERRKKKLKTQEDNIITARLQHQLVSVNNRTERGLISKFIQHMPAQDSLAIREYISEHEPGIDMTAEALCENPDCRELVEVDVPLGVNFFWPNTRK
jgi:hypothetical protein